MQKQQKKVLMALKHFGHSHGFFQIIYFREKTKYWKLKFSLPFFIYKITFFFFN